MVVPPRMDSTMRGTYNDSQMAAVTAGLEGSQVVLIQGPPGGPGGGRVCVCVCVHACWLFPLALVGALAGVAGQCQEGRAGV